MTPGKVIVSKLAGHIPVPKKKFFWLVELFMPGGNSSGYYHTGFSTLTGNSRNSTDAHQAKKYASHADAVRVAASLHHLRGVWRAVEHGFYT